MKKKNVKFGQSFNGFTLVQTLKGLNVVIEIV